MNQIAKLRGCQRVLSKNSVGASLYGKVVNYLHFCQEKHRNQVQINDMTKRHIICCSLIIFSF